MGPGATVPTSRATPPRHGLVVLAVLASPASVVPWDRQRKVIPVLLFLLFLAMVAYWGRWWRVVPVLVPAPLLLSPFPPRGSRHPHHRPRWRRLSVHLNGRFRRGAPTCTPAFRDSGQSSTRAPWVVYIRSLWRSANSRSSTQNPGYSLRILRNKGP